MDPLMALLTGFFSSLHCAGMCGPLVLAYAARSGDSQPGFGTVISSHLLYNAGRVLSYAVVGGALGFVGGSVGMLRGVGTWFSGGMGILTIGFAVYVLRGGAFIPTDSDIGSGWLSSRLLRLYRATFGALIAKATLRSRFSIGLLTPLLPCGLLYGVIVRSAGSGSAFEGAVVMAAFGLGIVPALITAGLAGSFLSSRTRRWADRIAAIFLLIMGASLIWRAVMAGLMGGSHAMH